MISRSGVLANSSRGTVSQSAGLACTGCGTQLQSNYEYSNGFIPDEALRTFNNGWKRMYVNPSGREADNLPDGVEITKSPTTRSYLKAVRPYCQRCFVTQQYRRDPMLFQLKSEYATTIVNSAEDVCSPMGINSIVVNILDITDFESSIVPELVEIVARRKIPIIHVINKMDCLPLETREWKHVTEWAIRLSRTLRAHLGINVKPNIIPISSISEKNFDLLETQLSLYMPTGVPMDIHVVGRENSGKSTFVNRFLHYIKHKHLGTVHHKRAVGGITRSPFRGTTVRPIEISLGNGIRLIDTPGISCPSDISKYFTCPEDYRDMLSGQKYQPLSHNVKYGKSLILGGMVRVEIVSGQSAIFTCFVPPRVTMHVCDSKQAVDVVRRKVGTFLYPPHISDSSRPAEEHPILQEEWVRHRVAVFCGPSKVHDEIVIPGVGWLGISGHGHKEIDVYVPTGVQVFRRPAMMTKHLQRTGVTKFNFRQRGRALSVNKKKKAAVQSMRAATKMCLTEANRVMPELSFASKPGQEVFESSDMMPDDGVRVAYENLA